MKKEEIFEKITNRIIESLEKGRIPWRQTWGFVEPAQNFYSKHAYSGVNSILMLLRDYETPFFATMNQINKAGGKVRKGEKATVIVFNKYLYRDLKGRNITQEQARAMHPSQYEKRYYLKYDWVFNISQCDGIPNDRPCAQTWDKKACVLECDLFIQQFTEAPRITSKLSDRASYNRATDVITVPLAEQFRSIEDFYATIFHELIHSTGHASRLNRETLTDSQKFGDLNYANEELTAEIGACYFCNHFGIDTAQVWENTEAYINGWIERLQNDPALIIKASKAAKQAFMFLHENIQTPDFYLP